MANKKPNYDLSNVGGQPKDWLQRGAEHDAESSGWPHIKMMGQFVLLAVLGSAVLGAIAWGAFRLFFQ